MKEVEKDLAKIFPCCKECNPELYEEVCQHVLIMTEVSKRISIPLDELIEFFYKGKLKLEVIKEQEEVLNRVKGNNILPEVQKNNG